MDKIDLHALLRRGEWVAVRRGAYTTRCRWEALEPHRERPVLQVRAASLAMVMPHVISHDSAALLHGMSIVTTTPALVHITRFGVVGSRTKCGVKHHRAPFTPDQVVFVDGLPVLDRARTAADICREHGSLRHGLPACDSAMRLGDSRADLAAAHAAMRSWPHVTTVREAVSLADPGAENVAESLARLLALELGLGPVQTQFGLRDGGREAWCDLRVGRHVIEVDGRLKYLPPEEGGVAQQPAADVLWREKKRQDWVCGFKLGMSRVTWRDLQPAQWEATQRRVLRECLDTNERFGTSIDDLAPYVVHVPRR